MFYFYFILHRVNKSAKLLTVSEDAWLNGAGNSLGLVEINRFVRNFQVYEK
jgi:hypothetical protein